MVLKRTAKSCGPDVTVLASSLAELSAGRRWQESRSPGRSRRKPLKPLRAGMPGDPGATVVTNARAFYTTHAAADALGIRHSPRPPGRMVLAKLGRIAPRECGC